MRIEVAGIPAPQGSKRHVGGGRMVEVSRAVGPWREAVRAETQRAMQCEFVDYKPDGPVAIHIEFYLPRPKSAAKTVVWPAKRPDLDKLLRSVLDGIVSGGGLLDDSQVIEILAIKMYATDTTPAGCIIQITEA